VNNHSFLFSYPELAGSFLDKWAQAMFGVRVEIINAGREGILSTDIAAVVRDEVLPLEPDLVVYYEGGNQFNPGSIVRLSNDPGPPPNLSADVPDPDVGYFGRRSAWVRRAQELLSTVLPEPRKPAYEVVWPSDVDEFDPPLSHRNLPAGLSTIMKDLDAINAAVVGSGGELVASSFFWLVYDGMKLDSVRHRYLYTYLNDTYYPYRYRDMERLAAFQNRVLEKFAADRDLLFMDIAATMPRDPNLFIDAVHATDVGVRLHAWMVAQKLAPWLRERIENGRLPRPPRSELQAHPAFPGNERTLLFDCSPDIRRARTVARVDLFAATPQTSSARVEAGSILKVEIAAETPLHRYAARIPIVTTDSAPRFDDHHTMQARPELRLQARIKITGGDARIGVLSADEQNFLTYQTVEESKEFVSVDVPFWGESVGPLIVAAGTTRPHDVVVELSDVSVVKVPAYSVGGVLQGLSEPPQP
jgi:hypothetical protein